MFFLISIIAMMFISIIIVIKSKFSAEGDKYDYHFIVAGKKEDGSELEKVLNILKEHSTEVNLRRVNETNEEFEAAFIIEFADYTQFRDATKQIKEIDRDLTITFMDQKGIA